MSRYALILAYTMPKFYAGFQLFDMKITSEGKPGLKIAFLRSDSTYGEAQYEVQGGVGIQGPCIPPSPSSLRVFNLSTRKPVHMVNQAKKFWKKFFVFKKSNPRLCSFTTSKDILILPCMAKIRGISLLTLTV